MYEAAQRKPRFNAAVAAHRVERFARTRVIGPSGIGGGAPSSLEHARVRDESPHIRCRSRRPARSRARGVRDIRVRKRGGGRLDGGFAGALLPCGCHDALLRGAQPDECDGGDPQDEDDDDERLAALVA